MLKENSNYEAPGMKVFQVGLKQIVATSGGWSQSAGDEVIIRDDYDGQEF